MKDNEKSLYDHFLINIKSGFESLEDIIDEALEAVEDEGWQREISEEWIRETLTREYEENEKQSKTWSTPTDVDKLTEVFDSLCRKEVLALHNIGNSISEAIYDTLEIWQKLEDEDKQPIGYCYYHGQDLERVIEEGELILGFSGVKENNEKEAIAIGNIIANELIDKGFDVQWNHTATERIKVVDFDWKNIFISDDFVDRTWGHDKVLSLMK